jgi:hypothetical protein
MHACIYDFMYVHVYVQLAEGAPEVDKAKAKQDAKEAAALGLRCRYKSKVEVAVEGILNGTLNKDKFPYAHEEYIVPDDYDFEDSTCGRFGAAGSPSTMRPCAPHCFLARLHDRARRICLARSSTTTPCFSPRMHVLAGFVVTACAGKPAAKPAKTPVQEEVKSKRTRQIRAGRGEDTPPAAGAGTGFRRSSDVRAALHASQLQRPCPFLQHAGATLVCRPPRCAEE